MLFSKEGVLGTCARESEEREMVLWSCVIIVLRVQEGVPLIADVFSRRVGLGPTFGQSQAAWPHTESPSWPGYEVEGKERCARSNILMIRCIALVRSSRPRTGPASCPSNVAALVRYQKFHSTAPAGSIGFKNFKNSPRLDWKVSAK